MDSIAPLPEPLGEPLPIFSVWPIAWWHVAFLALAAWWLWRRLRKKPPAPAPAAAPPPAPVQAAPVGPQRSPLSTRLIALEESYMVSQDYRAGCHALASLLRSFLERELGREMEALTATELAEALSDPRAGRFFISLRDAQYGERPPERETFRMLCRDARQLFDLWKRIELRGKP
ncbi:hypothetical protein [Hyalangium gracile]|uniref:hypothetical protein n=1 Tax=Hyalangium gracile TaxID=394092 RepID=UPI001CC9CFE4|nr:hypothetical protein [Hyalangium gracile]